MRTSRLQITAYVYHWTLMTHHDTIVVKLSSIQFGLAHVTLLQKGLTLCCIPCKPDTDKVRSNLDRFYDLVRLKAVFVVLEWSSTGKKLEAGDTQNQKVLETAQRSWIWPLGYPLPNCPHPHLSLFSHIQTIADSRSLQPPFINFCDFQSTKFKSVKV